MKYILKAICLAIAVASCSEPVKTKLVSEVSDYAGYLHSSKDSMSIKDLKKEEGFWVKKIGTEPRGFTFYEKLGSTYNRLFEKTGEIKYLHRADSSFAMAKKVANGKWKVSSLLSLSGLSIKKHDFKAAATYAVMANELTNQKFGPLLMQYDAEMELGNYKMAGAILKKARRTNSFDYLVRLSKYKDYSGDLDSAIFYMEKACGLIKAHQTERKLWATANLADMYGHAGRVEDSYNKYLEVLSLNPHYSYALKGIAWVAYSNDRKTGEAKEILKHLQQQTSMPDYYLLLAEISEFEAKESDAKFYKSLFSYEASKSKYLGMYNKYLIEILVERGHVEEALELAREEVAKRPTPETYDWLAWTMFNLGETEGALNIYQEYVEGQTFEPEVIYHMGLVYHSLNKRKGVEYLEESLEASYELGPLVVHEIESVLKV